MLRQCDTLGTAVDIKLDTVSEAASMAFNIHTVSKCTSSPKTVDNF